MDRKRTNKIQKNFETSRQNTFIYNKYVDGCMKERNQYMINNSSLVIALFNGQWGKTKQTIEYAKSQGVEVITINPVDNI